MASETYYCDDDDDEMLKAWWAAASDIDYDETIDCDIKQELLQAEDESYKSSANDDDDDGNDGDGDNNGYATNNNVDKEQKEEEYDTATPYVVTSAPVSIVPDHVESGNLMHILDERPLEALTNDLFGDEGTEFFPSFIDCMEDGDEEEQKETYQPLNIVKKEEEAKHFAVYVSSSENSDTEESGVVEDDVLAPVEEKVVVPNGATRSGNDEEESVSTDYDEEDDEDEKKDQSYESISSRDNHGERWNRHFQDLQDFYAVFGHSIVPNNYKENPTLAQWVKRQRHQHKLKAMRKHSTLTPERQAALEKLGFVWSAQEAMWEERFKELEAFREANGHCNVPSTFKQNPKLSIWVKSQRRQCKLYQRKDPCFITVDRFLKLKSVGFDWNPRNL